MASYIDALNGKHSDGNTMIDVSGLTGSEKDYDILEKLIIEILKAKNFTL